MEPEPSVTLDPVTPASPFAPNDRTVDQPRRKFLSILHFVISGNFDFSWADVKESLSFTPALAVPTALSSESDSADTAAYVCPPTLTSSVRMPEAGNLQPEADYIGRDV